MRAARTPPEPPPMTNRSTSKSAISSLDFADLDLLSFFRPQSDLLAALAHLGAELGIDGLCENLRPLLHIGHAHLNRTGLAGKELLAERGLVEGDEILDLLLGELVAVDLGHALADLLLLAREGLSDDNRDLVEILLIVQIALDQRVLGLLHNARHGAGIHRLRIFHSQNLARPGHAGRRARLQLQLLPQGRRLLRRNRASQDQSEAKAQPGHRQDSEKTLHSLISL